MVASAQDAEASGKKQSDGDVADSWEHDADEVDNADKQPTSEPPITTAAKNESEYTSPYRLAEPSTSNSTDDARPQKSTAVASRLIAAGLGVKVQRTADQKQYDMAVRKQAREQKEKDILARKRREEELAAASRAIWDD